MDTGHPEIGPLLVGAGWGLLRGLPAGDPAPLPMRCPRWAEVAAPVCRLPRPRENRDLEDLDQEA